MSTSFLSIYTELATNQFRLIELQPVLHNLSTSSQNEQKLLECTLKTVPLDGTTTYYALSYTWGDTSNLRPIKVNGSVIRVTASLEEALRYLQAELKPLILWADALCINQMDVQEKGEMVQQMKKIYQNADSVIVWLGPPADGSDMLIDSLNEISGEVLQTGILELTKAERMTWSKDDPEEMRNPIRRSVDRMIEKVDLSFPFHEYKMLLRRPWWSRVWVVQELSVACQVTFACGSKRIPFDQFTALFIFQWDLRRSLSRRLGAQVSLSPEGPKAMDAFMETQPVSTAGSMIGARRFYQGDFRETGKSLSLISLLIRANVSDTELIELGATDPRDRVFALIGLAEDAGSLNIYPDYSKSVRHVYTETARTLLQHGHLEVLALAQFQKFDVDLPSWVPDWRGDIRARNEAYKDKTLFCTGYARSSVVRSECLHDDVEVLSLNASFVDKIRKVGPPLKVGDDGLLDWSLAEKFLAQVNLFCEESDSLGEDIYKISMQRQEAFWRVSIADIEMCDYLGYKRATGSSLEGYNALWERLNLMQGIRLEISQEPGANTDRPNSADSNMERFIRRLFYSVDRCPFMTSRGYVGLGPNHTRPGDDVYIIFGAAVPFIVRNGNKGIYQLVGDTYVHGIMDGEFTENEFEAEDLQIY